MWKGGCKLPTLDLFHKDPRLLPALLQKVLLNLPKPLLPKVLPQGRSSQITPRPLLLALLFELRKRKTLKSIQSTAQYLQNVIKDQQLL